MAEGATRTKILTRTVPFVGSSLAYYNGGIDAIVLQLKETGGGGHLCSGCQCQGCSRESRIGQAGQYMNRRRPTSEGRLANNK